MVIELADCHECEGDALNIFFIWKRMGKASGSIKEKRLEDSVILCDQTPL